MGLLGKGSESMPLETLGVIHELMADIAMRTGAHDVRYCTQSGKLDPNSFSPSGRGSIVVYQLHLNENKPHWASVNGSILIEFDVKEESVCIGRAPDKSIELYASYPLRVSLGDPDLIDKIVKYIEITTETINPKPKELSFKEMIINAFKRWVK